MNRRSFLAVAAGSLALDGSLLPARPNLDSPKGLRLSITWGMLGRMPGAEGLA